MPVPFKVDGPQLVCGDHFLETVEQHGRCTRAPLTQEPVCTPQFELGVARSVRQPVVGGNPRCGTWRTTTVRKPNQPQLGHQPTYHMALTSVCTGIRTNRMRFVATGTTRRRRQLPRTFTPVGPVIVDVRLDADARTGLGQCSSRSTAKYSSSTRTGGSSSLLYQNASTEGKTRRRRTCGCSKVDVEDHRCNTKVPCAQQQARSLVHAPATEARPVRWRTELVPRTSNVATRHNSTSQET